MDRVRVILAAENRSIPVMVLNPLGDKGLRASYVILYSREQKQEGKKMKKMLEEFKAFIMRGNVLDMAIGVIIGGAFGAITTALVGNVITPLLAVLFNSPNADALNITLRAATEDSEAIVLGLGTFIGAIINFLVIALVMFAIVKSFNKAKEMAKKKEEEAPAAPPEPSAEEKLLTEIRDLLKAQK